MKTRSVWHSFQCAFAGWRHVVATGRNARIQVGIAMTVVALAAWLHVSRTDWVLLVISIGVVLAAEALNTAIESAVDLASPEHHDLAKRAKDAAAGAVLLLAITAVVVGLLVLIPQLLAKLHAA